MDLVELNSGEIAVRPRRSLECPFVVIVKIAVRRTSVNAWLFGRLRCCVATENASCERKDWWQLVKVSGNDLQTR